MRTFNNNFIDQVLGGGSDLVWLLEVTDGTTTHKIVSGKSTQISEPAALISVDPFGIKLDPLTRDIELGSINVTVRDAWVRQILVDGFRLKGQQATVKLGAMHLAEGDFETFFKGPVLDFLPTGDGQHVEIELEDALGILQEDIVGYWINQNPVQIIDNIIRARVGVDATLVDAVSMDVTQAQWASIGHFSASHTSANSDWYVDNTIRDPEPALDVLRELTPLINASLLVTEEGKITLKRFDSAAASVASWLPEQIIDFKTLEIDSRIVNQCNFGHRPDTGGKMHAVYTQDDTASQNAHKYPGTTKRIYKYDFESDWVIGNAYTALDASQAFVNAAATTILFRGASSGLFSGTKGARPKAGQPAVFKLSGSKPGYWLSNLNEMIKVTSLVPVSDIHKVKTEQVDPVDGSVDITFLNGTYTATGITRGFGTTTAQQSNTVTDITILKHMADAIIARFADGIQVIEITTSLREYAVEVTDFVDITWPAFVALSQDGLNADTFEVIGKETDPDAGEIRWTLASVGDASGAQESRGFSARGRTSNVTDILQDQATDAMTGQNFSDEGNDFSIGSGLTGTVTRGRTSNSMATAETTADDTHVFEASSDTYIFQSVGSGNTTYVPVPNGDPPPSQDADQTMIALVVTDATDITSFEQSEKPTEPIATGQTATQSESTNLVTNGNFLARGTRTVR